MDTMGLWQTPEHSAPNSVQAKMKKTIAQQHNNNDYNKNYDNKQQQSNSTRIQNSIGHDLFV